MRVLGGKGVLMLALLLGGATSYLSWRYVQEANAAANPPPLVPVVVAARPIPQRTVITAEMVQVKRLPQEARPPGAFSDPSQVIGRVSKTQLATGEHLMPHQVFLQRERSGLAFNIPETHRAVAVAVSEVIGSGGLILPGDRVDVYGLFDLKEPEQPVRVTAAPTPGPTPGPGANGGQAMGAAAWPREPTRNTLIALILQDLEVLAVAQNLEGEDNRSTTERLTEQGIGGGSGNGAPTSRARAAPQARTVTLAVTPLEAEKLILAEERGKIRLALRPATEQGSVVVPPLELRAVLQEPTK